MKKLATIKRFQVKGKNFRIYGFEHRDEKVTRQNVTEGVELRTKELWWLRHVERRQW